jgi:hypothetical protein
MRLTYHLSEDWNKAGLDLKTASEAELRYSAVLGDLFLESDNADLSARWGWIPLIDFAVSLQQIVGQLKPEPFQVFEFTESDATLNFLRSNQDIQISASYAPGRITVSYQELKTIARDFQNQLVTDLLKTYPELLENQWFIANFPKKEY